MMVVVFDYGGIFVGWMSFKKLLFIVFEYEFFELIGESFD